MSLCARIENLNVCAGAQNILSGLSLECPDRAITVLVGRSGSGKTTLLRSLNRLNDCFPALRTSGRVELKIGVRLRAVDDASLPLPELRRRAGMVFQSPNPLPLSVARNVLLPLQLTLGLKGTEAEGRMKQALEQVGLWEEVAGRLHQSAASLSGGQQQRLCLARTLALEPDVLLLDEPTASLDRRAAEVVEDLLLSLKERYPIVMVSHSLLQARRLADRLAVLRGGALRQIFDAAELPAGGEGELFIERLL